MVIFKSNRKGASVIDMLAVIAIVTILIATLLPAVQSAREAARRASCVNNIRQLCLALSSYEAARGSYPIGWHYARMAEGSPALLGCSSLVSLTAHMDHSAIFAAFNFDHSPHTYVNSTVASATISSLVCPSDISVGVNDEPIDVVGVKMKMSPSNYALNLGSWASIEPEVNVLPRLRQLNGIATLVGYPRDHPNPALRGLGVGTIRVAQIQDGLSSTIAVGEKIVFDQPSLAVPLPYIQRWNWWVSSNLGDTLFTEYVPINYYKWNRNPRVPSQAPAAIIGASSQHPGGANFGFCDGSVRFMKETIDSWRLGPTGLPVGVTRRVGFYEIQPGAHVGIYQALGTRNGREIVDQSSL